MKFKILGTEIACNTTPSTLGSARNVRLVNSNTTVRALVTHKNANAVTIGTVTLMPSQEIFVVKAATDTLESNNATIEVRAASVSVLG